ncbi:unnamed protein product [Alternaria burnsii]|nr:unnamed protein product [Alternaria burnsii]
MSHRETSKKAQEQYPPAPSVEVDDAAVENDNTEGFRQDTIDPYLAYERMAGLRLDNEEEENMNDASPDDSESTTEGHKHDEHYELPSLPSIQFRSVAVGPSQRPQAPRQYSAVPVPPPPTIILKNVSHTAPVVSLPVTEAEAWSQFLGRAPRDFVPRRPHYCQPGHASTNGYFESLYPRSAVSDGYSYSRSAGGVGHIAHPHHTMPARNRGPNGRVPIAMLRAVDRDLALREEPIELFEMWADTFSRSRRIEEDVVTLRERLRLLHQFYYRQ